MSSTLNKENKETGVVQNGDPDKSKTQDGTMKNYRVTLKCNVLVDIDVEAENEHKARGKAAYWKCVGASGYSKVGSYTWFDDDDHSRSEYGEGELFWEIVGEVKYHEDGGVVELDSDHDEHTLEDVAP